MDTNDTILFNVNDELGKVVDYIHIPEEYQDIQCGNYLREQAELALGGTYIPEETVYCLQIDKDIEMDILSVLHEVIYNGELEDLPFIPLRSLVFAHEISAGGLPGHMFNTVSLLERINDDPDTAKVLEEYIRYHSEKMNNTPERTVTSIQSENGVLLFDDTGRGIQCMERYLQYLADNYFSSALKGIDSLDIYYFSTTNNNIVEDSRRCACMFTPEKPHCFIPSEGMYYPKDLMKGYSPSVQCSLKPCENDYDQFLRRFKLDRNELMTDIARLDYIYKNGIDSSQASYGFIHENSFEQIYNKLAYSYLNGSEHSPLSKALQKTAKDVAGRILRTEYNVRGYELSKPEKKEEKKETRKNNNPIKL
ncbi:DUF6047 family protein [Bacteroides ovatus]|uniref:DUF6047 family protein n=3 Tax=Bacteroides TaxID=816 RepID=UPI00319EA6A3